MKKIIALVLTTICTMTILTSCNKSEPVTIWINQSDTLGEYVVMALNEELTYFEVPSDDAKLFVAVMNSEQLTEHYEELENAKTYNEAITILKSYKLTDGFMKDLKRA